jgi:4-amino-4-deoxy-L-arabinose transferase-like glycosyltransferase
MIEGMDIKTLWMPPLYFFYSSIFIQIFGSTLFAVRFGSIFASILCIFPIFGIAKKMGISEKSQLFLVAILLTDILFFKISSTARMESLCLFFSSISLYILYTDWKDLQKYIFSGFFLGLGTISHPFGFVFSLLAVVVIFFRSSLRMKNLFLMAFGGIIPLLGWGLYIAPNFDLFILQFGAQLGRKKDLLVSVFTLVTKIKIILSGFKYPTTKLIGLVLLFVLILSLLKNRNLNLENKKNIIVHSLCFFILIAFIFLSSESWYVYYIVPFVSILVCLVFEYGNQIQKRIAFFFLIYNLIIIGVFINANFILNSTKDLQEIYFNEIYQYTKNSKKVYLQAIPDPYFFLSEKNTNFEIREFIPGELPLSEEFPIEEMSSQDVFIFYNEELIHPFLKNFLQKNSNLFDRYEVNVPTPKGYEYKLFAIIYRKKHKNTLLL